ncbi:class I SAM-dependent methyltransferase [Kineosporia rhizophila]|uniref:class I SAM-dependent methyltransferase n=1 Tax=Kineosporia rhizophila TaxID=84633 RepID=UPI000B2EF51B|nr:class I SAM-dependent methyltransferase [Kineosporia rhizophila]MCE0539555.1 class I SAM-dependent methyltransferase [Kineosporia rhizophila]
MDWGAGRYERQARQLLPAVEQIVDELAPVAGEVVVDVGCGSGNATVLVAGRGARVTGVDPSPRLLEVACEQMDVRGLVGRFHQGDAANLPLAAGSADAVISSFGLIFAPDPSAAVQEIARVLRPGGRLVFSAWLPEGAMAAQGVLVQSLLTCDKSLSASFAWHDLEAVACLLNPLGFSVSRRMCSLAFVGESPRAAAEAELANHPRWAWLREVVGAGPRWDQACEALVSVFEDANEDPAAFRVTSRFIVYRAVLDAVPSEKP